MRRLLLTVSLSALFLFAPGQSAHSDSESGISSAPPTLGNAVINSVRESPAEFPAAIDGPARAPTSGFGYKAIVLTDANGAQPIVIVQHDLPPNIDLKARPRIARDLAVALHEPSFAIFATAMTFLLGMALFALRRILS